MSTVSIESSASSPANFSNPEPTPTATNLIDKHTNEKGTLDTRALAAEVVEISVQNAEAARALWENIGQQLSNANAPIDAEYFYQDYEKLSFDLKNVEARGQAESLGIRWERPAGDNRSASQIVESTPLLKNLGNQSHVKDMLKERVGNFEKDADAAYRAAQVLEHIETLDSSGATIAGKDVGNGSINGFTKSGEAKHGTEAGRLQDFGKYGFSHLKGELMHPDAVVIDKNARTQAENLGIIWELPSNDNRSAEEIIKSDSLLANLGNQSGIKDRLKDRVGDFEKDANAAYRALQVLHHIEKLDADGKTLTGKDIDNGKIDGFTKSGEAKPGTEAGRLQDFGKYGFSSLNGPKPSEVDFSRKSAGLAPESEMDIGKLETSTTDPNDKNRKLTVSELTWQNLTEEWKKGINDGSIGKDDERAKLYNALRAQAASEQGLNMVTLDIAKGQGITKVKGEDLSSIIDRTKLDQTTAELFSSTKVQEDFLKHQKNALDALPNKDAVREKIEKMAFSKEYPLYLADLKANGKDEIAKADIGSTYASLAAFDREKAGHFAQMMLIDATTIDLNNLLAKPEEIDDENTALATQDTMKTLLTTLKKGGVDLVRRSVESERFFQEFLGNKQTAKAFGESLKELGAVFQKNQTITPQDINKVMEKDIYKSLGEGARGSAIKTLTELNSNGLLGSAGGLISLTSGVYQVAGKGGSLADTPEERLAIAKEFVSVLGAGQHFVNLGTVIYDKVNNTQVNKMLGLDKSLPEIFGKEVPQGSGRNISGTELGKIWKDFDAAVSAAPDNNWRVLSDKLDLTQEQWKTFNEGFKDGFVRKPGLEGSTLTSRSFSSFLRVMDAGANVFGGVADLALGGLKIKSGTQHDDKVTVAQGAITVASGAFTLGGGIAQGAALAGSSVAKALSAPLLWAGAGLTVALTPFLIYDDIKHNNSMNAHRDDLQDLFKNLNAQGLLTEDGQQRYDFLDNYIHSYGQRDAPDDKSIFDYRKDEYDFFVKYGRLPSGFGDISHVDYDGDGSNLDTKMDKGSTVGS